MSKYITVGTIKTIDLTNHTFTIEPVTVYRFQTKDDDENSWKIIFKEEDEDEPKELKLVANDSKFKFAPDLSSAFIMLKQSKARIRMNIEGKVDETTKTSVPDLGKEVIIGIL